MKRHINEFVKLKCASDLLALKLFPNAKEITESMAAFNAVRSHISRQCSAAFADDTIALVSVGDGHTPRTAAMFAFRTAWHCYSIDPLLREKEWPIKRLIVLRRKVEDEVLDLSSFSQVIVVMVHSHAPMNAVLQNIRAKRLHIMSIPCCVPHDIKHETYLGYQDESIWSPKNTVKIWCDVNTGL